MSPNSALKILNKYDNNSTPTSIANRSTSNYTDYALSKDSIAKSPDRLKILKTTMRTNTSSTENSVSNKYLIYDLEWHVTFLK